MRYNLQGKLSKLHPLYAGVVLALVTDPEERGVMFVRKVGLPQNTTALQHGRPYSAKTSFFAYTMILLQV
jgi:hypothetical protein